jgi:leukotriene-A4 hydrolase
MMTRVLPLVLLALTLARNGAAAPPASGDDTRHDWHSFANVDAFRVTGLDLDLTVDFVARRLFGTAELEFVRVAGAARTLVLDSRDLDVRKVWLLRGAQAPLALPFRFGERDAVRGAPLRIELPAGAAPAPPQALKVRVEYGTRPTAAGLQWLTPAQSADKRTPFLFSQSESIQARSWVPLQDTPQVRFAYRATIHAPTGLRVVMAAGSAPAGQTAAPAGVFRFDMPQPIPSYLLAIAVGRLEFRALGPRSGVYAAPGVIDAAAREFSDMESMIATCERLFGPYRWGRYDVLVLPPSFPLGGMENPRLSFITPTIIAGDKSLVAVIAHELAHSWSGNLVGNATWRDFWLNEGFTTYIERRILEALYGARRAAMEDVLGLEELRTALTQLKPAEQVLAIDLRGRDPEDNVNPVPYEKGRLFLGWLEARCGRAALQEFLARYFAHFAFQSITTEQFAQYLRANLLAQHPGVVREAELEEWLYQPGLPAFAVLPQSDALTRVDALRADWLAGKLTVSALPTHDWSTQEWQHFIDGLPETLEPARLAELDAAYHLTTTSNAEIACSWFKVAIRNDYGPAYDPLELYLTHIGRRKLVKPLYEALMKTPAGAAHARRIYRLARPGYHPLTAAAVDPIVLGPHGAASDSGS